MGFDVSGNISDVLCAELGFESRHAVFAVGHLIGDGCLLAFVVVRDVSLEIVLLMSALTFNDVVSSNHVVWVRHLAPEGQPMDSKKMIL